MAITRKENIITEMLTELARGITYKDCLDLMDLNWSLGPSTFKRYWKEANDRYRGFNVTAQKAIEATVVELATEKARSRILDKYERMEILSQIARGEVIVPKPMVCDGVIEYPAVEADWQSRKAAIAELNKMDGEYAPIKKDITTGGEKINTVVKWGDNEISI